MKQKFISRFLLTASALLGSHFAHAAAFQFYELGAPINGTAGVGQAVITQDASNAYYNPAAMVELHSTEFLLGAQTALSYVNFSPSSANTIPGNNGSNAGGLIPGADAYFVYNYAPRLKFGASLTMPYGGSLNYDNHWVGRYNVQQMLLYTLNFNPSLAYQVNDWLALGAGIAIEYANLYQTVAIPISPTVDGQGTVKADNTSPGLNLGAYMEPSAATKIGLAWRSQIIHNLRGNVSFMNVGITPAMNTKLIMPANVILSLSQMINCKLTLLGELGWANWSTMENTIVNVGGVSAVTPQNWHDTYRIGVGTRYHFLPDYTLQAGVSFDSSPTSSSHRLPELPMDKQVRIGLGLLYDISKFVNLSVSYEYLNLGNASINNTSSAGVLAGSYDRDYANFLQASLNVVC